ncbi:MAG: alpha-ketoglutarate-dependent dioxygenase AlkB [Maribacter sp.]|nr:alpha-ketoglutarate-dependent dioxygenase AlkB [Maribacter sp.]
MKRYLEKKIALQLPNSDIVYYPNFLDLPLADYYFAIFKKTIAWQQDDIKVFGKVYRQPRLTALYADNGKPYSYSNLSMRPRDFTDDLLQIRQKVETLSHVRFTHCLLNLYRDGQDSNGWHADNEKSLGKNPIIASVSLGQERSFHLKHKTDPSCHHKMILAHGSLLMMQGETQQYWLHQIPKTKKVIGERINLTFRVIK